MDVNEHSLPFYAGDGRVGVLFCHGFTGSPDALRPWSERVLNAGYRVALPRLPGHGTSWQEMNVTTWKDWYSAVERDFSTLARECDQVFVAGLSMGGALALRLAQRHRTQVAGVMLVNPLVMLTDKRLWALPVIRRVVPTFPAVGGDIAKPDAIEHAYDRLPLNALASSLRLYADVRASLDLVIAPLIVWRSEQDHRVPAISNDLVLRHVSSEDITERRLPRSYHVATLDYEAEQIVDDSLEFLTRLRR